MGIPKSIVGERIMPFLGVIGALLIFVSWAVNSGIVEKHKKNTSSMAQVITQKRMFQALNTLSDIQNDLLHKIQNIDAMISQFVVAETDNPLIKQDKYFFQYLKNSERISADYQRILNLFNNAAVLSDLSLTVLLPDEETKKIAKTVSEVNQFYFLYYNNKQKLEKLVVTPPHGPSWWKASEQVLENENELDKLEDKYYLDLINRILAHYDFMYHYAKEQLALSSKLSSISGKISVFIYVLGSILIIIGKWKDEKEKNNR